MEINGAGGYFQEKENFNTVKCFDLGIYQSKCFLRFKTRYFKIQSKYFLKFKTRY